MVWALPDPTRVPSLEEGMIEGSVLDGAEEELLAILVDRSGGSSMLGRT